MVAAAQESLAEARRQLERQRRLVEQRFAVPRCLQRSKRVA